VKSQDSKSDLRNEPDVTKPISNIIQTSRSSTIPRHWNNSPYLSGGRYGAGSNPKKKHKKKMGYIDSYKKYSKKLEEDQMVMGQNPQAGLVPSQFQAESDSLSQEEANLLKQLANVKERRIALDRKIADAKKQQAEKAAQLAAQQANQAAQ
jgi:hypothetical protein